jgi:hypothetical protein
MSWENGSVSGSGVKQPRKNDKAGEYTGTVCMVTRGRQSLRGLIGLLGP